MVIHWLYFVQAYLLQRHQTEIRARGVERQDDVNSVSNNFFLNVFITVRLVTTIVSDPELLIEAF